MTHEPDFYQKIYDTMSRDDTKHDYQKSGVPIGNERMNKKVSFRTEAPLIKYHQKIYTSYCLISLTSEFHYIGDNRDVTALVNHMIAVLMVYLEVND